MRTSSTQSDVSLAGVRITAGTLTATTNPNGTLACAVCSATVAFAGGKGPRHTEQDHIDAIVLVSRLMKVLRSDGQVALESHVKLVDTTQGTRIDLADDADLSMFRLGTTLLTPDARQLLDAIAQAVGTDQAEITVRGHTDALPWKPGGDDGILGGANNWSLSAGRAEVTRQAPLRAAIAESRYHRIEGVADMELLVKDNPQGPRNRRISIALMK